MRIYAAIALCAVWLGSAGVSETYAEEALFPITTHINGTATTSEALLPVDSIGDLATLDLGGDGTSEIAISATREYTPTIFLIRQDGSLINRWNAYHETFRGGVQVATGDLDGDGTPEIITAPIQDGGPHIRIFSGFGEPVISAGFFAGEKTSRARLYIDVMRFSSTTRHDIAVMSYEDGRATLRIYSAYGTLLSRAPLEEPPSAIESIAGIDIGGDGIDELLVTGTNTANERRISLYRNDGSRIRRFTIESRYPVIGAAIPNPAAIAAMDLLLPTDRAIARYDGFGILQQLHPHTEPVMPLATAVQRQGEYGVLTIPSKIRSIDEPGKIIVITPDNQQLSYYENGYRINSFPVSTGKASTPTPAGEFAINNKVRRAWSNSAHLWMPYWMSFIGGRYGIHELPEWPNGAKEGLEHLGTPVSGGCVRLGIGAAQTLYDWAEIGTPVIVREQ